MIYGWDEKGIPAHVGMSREVDVFILVTGCIPQTRGLASTPKIGPTDKLVYLQSGGQKYAKEEFYTRTDHSKAT